MCFSILAGALEGLAEAFGGDFERCEVVGIAVLAGPVHRGPPVAVDHGSALEHVPVEERRGCPAAPVRLVRIAPPGRLAAHPVLGPSGELPAPVGAGVPPEGGGDLGAVLAHSDTQVHGPTVRGVRFHRSFRAKSGARHVPYVADVTEQPLDIRKPRAHHLTCLTCLTPHGDPR